MDIGGNVYSGSRQGNTTIIRDVDGRQDDRNSKKWTYECDNINSSYSINSWTPTNTNRANHKEGEKEN